MGANNLKPILTFLSELEHNNNKLWFDRNRDSYDEARQLFEELVIALISEVGKFEDLGGLMPKDCVFRINRDLRFSKDKSPYKTAMSAVIGPGGKKQTSLPYYVHLEPRGRSMLGGGHYMPTPGQLARWRQAVDQDAARLNKIIHHKNFVSAFGALEGDKLKSAPKGYSRDHPEIELLRLKQLVVVHRLTDKEVLSPEFVKETAKAFKTMKPFLDYLNQSLGSMSAGSE
ncbi:MAG: DUF2461 domain-containing protein [Chloroflexi bacterium]|nr:DUF2461 domain-containing protein [Chloroflexota bacterium]